MDIKKIIGERIRTERSALKLTRKELSALTSLKQSRINNWERGDRTPGPEVIQQLAKTFDVPAAYLMGLSDEKIPKKDLSLGRLIPVLNLQQAQDPIKNVQEIKMQQDIEPAEFIPISIDMAEFLSEYAYALIMPDESMMPDLKQRDILIIDPDKLPRPGELVVAKLKGNHEVIVRRYKQLSASGNMPQFELLASNPHWANIQNTVELECQLVGTLYGLTRILC